MDPLPDPSRREPAGSPPDRRPARGRLVVVASNGHGEDAIGARVARELLRLEPSLLLRAYPTVGAGRAYADAGIEVLGPRRELPSGGLTLHGLEPLLADLRAGLPRLLARQAFDLAALRADALLVVGDLWLQALCAPARARARFVLQPLVSVRHAEGEARPAWNRLAMERITAPERFLMRHRAHAVYARDEATAAWLRARRVPRAVALGNPAIDALTGPAAGASRVEGLEPGTPVLALLPGTRAYAPRALARMLAALEALARRRGGALEALVAWAWSPPAGAAPPDEPDPLPAPPPAPEGWRLEPPGPADPAGTLGAYVLERGGVRARLLEGRFADVLRSADVALGTSGTANEQAAALGVPVVAFPVEPDYSRAFLANQRRLLGAALAIAEPAPDAVARLLAERLDDPALREEAAAVGRERMGGPGGAAAVAADLLARARALGAL